MHKWKKLVKIILVFFLVLAILFGLIKACSTIMFGDCGYQDQLKPYEELSQDHLKNLYWKMESIFTNETEFHLNREKAIEKYPELSSLQFNHIDITHKWMVIGGCFDDKAMLFFGGFILTEEDPSITLSYGDGPNRKDEILWKGTANTPNK